MRCNQDAYGHQVYDYLNGKRDVWEIVERDDGFFRVSAGARYYFAPYAHWHDRERGQSATSEDECSILVA